MERPEISDELLAELYQQALSEVTIEGLEATGRQWQAVGDKLRDAVQNLLTISSTLKGIPSRDFAHLIILNGLSILAVANYRERSN